MQEPLSPQRYKVARVSTVGTQARTPVEDLEREIDAILETHVPEGLRRRRLAVTDENIRRLFGVTLWDLFRALAEKFGYEIVDEPETESKTS